MKIGIYPGTFDPIHSGHIAFARQALQQCGLDRVYFLPEPSPRRKSGVTLLEHRRAMIDRALRGQPGLAIAAATQNQFDIKQTLPSLQRQFAGHQLYLLVGSDVALGMDESWPDLVVLLRAWPLCIGLRAGSRSAELEEHFKRLEDQFGITVQRVYIQTIQGHLSSSAVRSGSTAHQPIAAVDQYRQEHKLYRNGDMSTIN